MHVHTHRAPGVARWARLLVALFASALAAGFAAAPAGAQAVFRVDSLANTTVAPGGTLNYNLLMTNVGDATADGTGGDPIVLSGTLPAGITAQAMTIFGGFDVSAAGWNCTGDGGGGGLAGASNFSCSVPDTIGPHSSILGIGVFASPTLATLVDGGGGASGTLTARFGLSGGGASPADTADPTLVTTAPPQFGVDALDGQVNSDAAGDPLTQAGGHPYSASVSIDFNTEHNPLQLVGDLWPVEPVKDVITDLPAGFVGDPTGSDTCTAGELANGASTQALPLCPATSQVGTAMLRFNGGTGFASPFGPVPVFNMVPPPDVPARFGMNVLGSVITLDAKVRSGGDYGVTITASDVPEALAVAGTTVTLWGVPSDPSHDAERACPDSDPPFLGGPSCANSAPAHAFLRNPTSCTDPGVGLTTTARIDSWTNPGDFVSTSFISHLPPGYPLPPADWGAEAGTDGCGNVPFTPALRGTPGTTRASSPAGFSFDLTLPQSSDPTVVGESDLKTAVVTLPSGLSVSPSSADGLAACAPGQIRLHDESDPSCPLGSKLGTATVRTPLLRDPLQGAVYLGAPHDNPFGTLLSLYLVAKGPGVVLKLPGRVDADPVTGQLTATFDNNPQLPFSDLHLEFKGGARAPLAMPAQCGAYTTVAHLTGWNGRTVESDSTFTVSGDGNGGPCSGAQFSPAFRAGTVNPVAGKTTALDVAFARGDADQQLKSVTVDTPSGLTGKIANTVLCADAAATAGTCGEASKIGSVTVGAGAGSDPFYITNGRVYITGPYKGAPFGLSIVVPAVAGPFDLGNVVVRSALFVDKHDASLRVVSDPLPTILQGIPLDVRDVRVNVDKPDFVINPTSCAQKTISGQIDSTGGMTTDDSDRFQVGECASLGFKPRMVLSVGGTGHTARNRTTPLSTTLTMPPKGQANLRFVQVTLPDTINARLTVINDACTRQQFETDIRACDHAKAGTATAVTPLLRDPLRGSVYFVKTGRPGFPNLIVALRGQVSFDLIGRITIPHSRFLRTTFPAAPDVPVRSFTLRLFGDNKNGSVGAAANLCSAKSRAQPALLDYVAQNGKVLQVAQRLVVHGCARHGRKARR
jgi:hypothetical protein